MKSKIISIGTSIIISTGGLDCNASEYESMSLPEEMAEMVNYKCGNILENQVCEVFAGEYYTTDGTRVQKDVELQYEEIAAAEEE